MFSELLAYLSQRRRGENDLSDITWAACSACPSLRRSFLAFFFPDVVFKSDVVFEREYVMGDSRPDFYIRSGEDIYLIENKIHDRNHHFDQYTVAFGIPAERLGYIANYPMWQNGYTVHSWEELHDYLHEHFPSNSEEQTIWHAYLEYVKNVCSLYRKPERIDLQGMFSLYAFCRELRTLVSRQTDFYVSELYNNRKDTHGGGNRYGSMQDGIAGCYFHLQYTDAPIAECWPWIGIYFNYENPLICIAFENNSGWGKAVCDLLPLSRVETLLAGDFYEKPYYEDGSLFFELSHTKHAEFQNSNLAGQRSIIEGFIDEVIKLPIKI